MKFNIETKWRVTFRVENSGGLEFNEIVQASTILGATDQAIGIRLKAEERYKHEINIIGINLAE